MSPTRVFQLLLWGGLLLPACEGHPPEAARPADTTPAAGVTAAPPGSTRAAGTSAAVSAGSAEPAASSVTLIAGGDVSLARMRGQRLLREPDRNDFHNLMPLLQSTDLRFVNLESTISEQGGQTVSPYSKLVFTAPPGATEALVRGRIDIVALANNHAWDYGRSALLGTLDRLDRAGIAYVGAGRTRAEAYGPRVVAHRGFKIAFVAVTTIWNQSISPHPGRDLIADGQIETLVESVEQARAIKGVDKVIVSHHGGYEYVPTPHQGTRELLRAAIEAGADVVLGHHPHVIQRVAFVSGKPIFYSLGNLLMRMVTGKPETEIGMLARVVLSRDRPTTVEVCPFRLFGLEPIPLSGDEQRDIYQKMFTVKLEQLLAAGRLEEPDSAARLGAFRPDGCAPITPAPEPQP